MNTITISIVSGFVVFMGVYLSFDYWYQRIWMQMLLITDDTFATYKDLFIFKTKDQVMRDQLLVSGILSILMLVIFFSVLPLGLLIAGFVFFHSWRLPRFFLKTFIKPQRVSNLSVQMIDGLTLMANGLKAGLSVPQALEIVVKEMPAPISQEFGQVLNANQVGTPLDVAFEELMKRMGSEDVSMFVTSVNILSETGGNQAETYQNIVKTIRERIKLQQKITAMTAQGMTSAVIVGILPWALAVMLYIADAERMKPLFFTPPGWVILLLVLILEAVGFFVILKIVKIKV
jgi:tight adherence protein B